jgi:hypothetical protein
VWLFKPRSHGRKRDAGRQPGLCDVVIFLGPDSTHVPL